MTVRGCATEGCKRPVLRPLPVLYCEECCLDQIGDEIEKRPIGAVYSATRGYAPEGPIAAVLAELERLLEKACGPDGDRYLTDYTAALADSFPRLAEALKRLELLAHTDECMAYAARTHRAFCIAPCARLRKGELTPEGYRAEVRAAGGAPSTEEDAALTATMNELRDLAQSVAAGSTTEPEATGRCSEMCTRHGPMAVRALSAFYELQVKRFKSVTQ